MKINTNNYEMYFLDYHEGRLPVEQVAELFLFLEQNPGLKNEFESYESISLPEAKAMEFPGKSLLKRGDIDEKNYSWYFIGHIERNLSADEELMLQNFLKSFPVYQSELEIFKKTKLQPDLSVIFSDKKELKKPNSLIVSSRAWYYLAAAACIIFLLGVFFMKQDNHDGSQMAVQNAPGIVEPVKDSTVNPYEKENQSVNKKSTENEAALVAEAEDGDKIIPDKKQTDKGKRTKPENGSDFENGGVNQKPLAVNQKLKSNTSKEKTPLTNLIQPLKENIAYMQPIEMNLFSEKQELSLAGTENKIEPEFYYTLTASVDNQPEYPSIGKFLTQYSKEKFKQTINNKPLANELMNKKIPGKVKGIKFIGWCYERLTGKKVQVETKYNFKGELTAYHISSGSFQYGKTFASE